MLTKTKSGISLYDPNLILPADADRLFAGLAKLPWKQLSPIGSTNKREH
jgi:hypothetical protein